MSTISGKYQKQYLSSQFAHDLFTSTGSKLSVAIASLVHRVHVRDAILKKDFSITQNASGVNFDYRVPHELRLMDLRRWGKRRKPNYISVYNKPLTGFIYGYLYKQLIWGYSQYINETVNQSLSDAGFK
jgi:hypothetical protein